LLEVTLFSMRTYYIWQNRRRDGKIARGEVMADTLFTHSFEDVTDRVSYIYHGTMQRVNLTIK
jgi:hypothetical protein